MNAKYYRLAPCVLTVLVTLFANASAQPTRRSSPSSELPANTQLNIMRHEDERRWDDQLNALLADNNPKVRKRAALAAGRIGDERAVPVLAEMLLADTDVDVRQMAAFALGEIESAGGAFALVTVLNDPAGAGRARAIEALGKVTSALESKTAAASKDAANAEVDRLDICKAAIVNALRFENGRGPHRDRLTVLLGLTAVLRTKPDGVGPLMTKFLDDPDPSIVATALNTMARLRLKDANERVRQLLSNGDPIVRANAARVIGAADHKEGFDDLLAHALNDSDLRVRVSAIRALGSLKDARSSKPLLTRGIILLSRAKSTRVNRPSELNEILEIVSTLGNLLRNSKSSETINWLRDVRALVNAKAPEVEVALARIDPELYVTEEAKFGAGSPASIAAGLTEIATIKKSQPELEKSTKFLPSWMHDVLECGHDSSAKSTELKRPVVGKCLLHPISVSPFLQAYAAYRPDDLDKILREHLQDTDVIVRSTAAELIGQRPPSEPNTHALIEALPRAMRDKDLNDAALAILDALGKQKTATANDAIKTGLNSSDQQIRRRAVALLKANGAGDFSARIGTVQTRNTGLDYRRAIARAGKPVTATIVTSSGRFTIELSPEDAPLTVDNFVQLARRGYFNGQTIPRVVPNFVVQAGDPRGDQNGGPGYQIRCEINEAPFERAAVGMALSGKDTGGSQWFVTHSPQPHLDGGYTVFGHVIRGMDVIDNIARGDVIRRVIVNEK
ncbi:MAG TPA: HEAT repeat domain-containing protein [Pyrinomonadaceae bacterium]